ncbi:sensor histidine kinase [Paenibacillus sp. 1011MAR3C5]|uniref:sensor histidine kinase n=1 Tax=Paenibacillus sp. 1011MAR3C5 TaxID=1675787 RepID=UPI000E6B84B8|nr:HAMP domain-containing sensor histidine kinase [Paenibacillus sp. 1011MAR3C5]RJE90380.1 sensor histidine kinase [Paenibacillus sp. 1011MAR3C5]
MKFNYRLGLRLVLHVIFSLILLALSISGSISLTEWMIPQEGVRQDNLGLISMYVILGGFMIVFAWSIGKPLYYIIRWINRLANGIYVEPQNHWKIYSSKKKKLKRPYRLFQELFIQLQTLSDTLEKSKQERSRLDEMKKEWIAGISHDLKTPLTYIKGYSSMMLSPQYEWTKEEQTGFLMEIEQKASHMEDLIGDLNISFRLDEQQPPLKREKTDLIELVRRIVVDVTNDPRAARHHLFLETSESHIEARLDVKLLGRALHNLVLNAVLHNPEGTNVNIQIRQDSHLHIMITDDGVGMEEAALDQLFNKYYRGTSTDILSAGTGLGMAIAKQLVLAHGGEIEATSLVHEGTSISVKLPLHN